MYIIYFPKTGRTTISDLPLRKLTGHLGKMKGLAPQSDGRVFIFEDALVRRPYKGENIEIYLPRPCYC